MRTIAPQVRRAQPAPLPRPAGAPPIELHVEALVLHGFARGDGWRTAAALREELARLVGEHGLPGVAALDERARLDAGAVRAGARPEATGRRIARAIHGGLRP
jgi:hypothetical protein